MNRQIQFRELFRFCEDIRLQRSKITCLCSRRLPRHANCSCWLCWHHVRVVVDYADTLSAEQNSIWALKCTVQSLLCVLCSLKSSILLVQYSIRTLQFQEQSGLYLHNKRQKSILFILYSRIQLSAGLTLIKQSFLGIYCEIEPFVLENGKG